MTDDGAVFVSGGTGFIGRRLVQSLRSATIPVRVVSRTPETAAAGSGVTAFGWDGVRAPEASLRGCRAAVHLSGEPLLGLPTPAHLERVRESRIASTRALVASLAALPEADRPPTFVCASAVGYYGDRGEEELVETSPPGKGPVAELCCDWEAEAAAAAQHGVRVVSLRIGVVLARDGGALGQLLPVFRLGLGGPIGGGRQWFPWIEANDLVRLIRFAIDTPELEGVVNAVAPHPVRQQDFARALGRAVGRPALVPLPGFALRAALGPLAAELLGSRRVHPDRALRAGFRFDEPHLEEALADELGRS